MMDEYLLKTLIVDWTVPTTIDYILENFPNFDPKIPGFVKLSQNPKIWQMRSLGPLASWIQGRTCLVGDAAHAMLPSWYPS